MSDTKETSGREKQTYDSLLKQVVQPCKLARIDGVVELDDLGIPRNVTCVKVAEPFL
jgi:hypothetical protein